MVDVSLTIQIATISRPTLFSTLWSLRYHNMLAPGDEIMLIGDGPQPAAKAMWDQMHLPGRYVEVPGGPHRDWGHTARNTMMAEARAAYLMAGDDDDEWTPGALEIIRRALRENPGRPHLFRMSGVPGIGDVWNDREIREGNVGTPLLVVPTAGRKWGRYTNHPAGDHDFIRDTIAMWPPDSLVWREEVIYKVRPWQ